MNILIVDDDPQDRLIKAFQKKGHEVVQKFGTEKALVIYKDFDIIVSDVDLGEPKTGFDFYGEIKDDFPGKIFLRSASNESMWKAIKLSIPFYHKNIDEYELVEKILQ